MCSPSQEEMGQEAERLSQWQEAQHQLVQVSPEVRTGAGVGNSAWDKCKLAVEGKFLAYQKCEGRGWEGKRGWEIEDTSHVSFIQLISTKH